MWDECASRRASTSRIVANAGANVLEVSPRLIARPHADLLSHSIAIVGLDGLPQASNTAINAIRLLASGMKTVIAHHRGSAAWPLGVRCCVLLAGACCLLDDDAPDFEHTLRLRLEQLLRVEAARSAEDAELTRTMSALGVVGGSAAALSLFRWTVRVSRLSDLPTLITGETGTGKELLAGAIARLDPKRSQGPFIAVNCGAVSQGILESELFGHRRGSFTGADRDRKGLIRSAERGVLFLDEIGEFDLPAQAKLLRVLQERRVLGVGEDQDVPVDVRVIAATNRDLGEMTRAGSFRADLFHRLNALTVHVPPLRQRPADIAALVEYFIDRNRDLHPSPLTVDPEFIKALSALELRGNARQLENLVRRALIVKEPDAPLGLPHLPPDILQRLQEDDAAGVAPAGTSTGAALSTATLTDLLQQLVSQGWSLSKSLEYCERSLVQSALRLADGNQSRTARLLGITPRSVYKKVHRHSLRS